MQGVSWKEGVAYVGYTNISINPLVLNSMFVTDSVEVFGGSSPVSDVVPLRSPLPQLH